MSAAPVASIPTTLYLGDVMFHQPTGARRIAADAAKLLPRLLLCQGVFRGVIPTLLLVAGLGNEDAGMADAGPLLIFLLVCLLTIGESGPVTLSGLARQVHLSPSTVLGIVDRLSNKGLVRRDRDTKDRRLVQITLTDAGRLLIVDAPSPLQDTLAEAMGELPDDQQATIARSLERIVEMMEVRHIDASPILETGPIAPAADRTEENDS